MEFGRWSRVEDLFHQVADLTPAERSYFLDRACNGDAELRRELESLLAADSSKDSFLQSAVDLVVDQLPKAADEGRDSIGKRVGRYTITRFIGKGGMGAVFQAVREDDFQMQVAIKLLKRGTDTETALHRFYSERQILAKLQHPNIARLLDGGTSGSGLPFFVMEYVDGTPILEYAAPLPVRQRLELFRAVCVAAQYAHEHQIVHRDIKPGNILVNRDGIPKLLDFGIAKLLNPSEKGAATTSTIAGVRLMTPDYASPEQVRGEPVTAATDIYSLGAVLYELLTDQRAHHLETYSPSEIEKEICTREPKKPSAIVKHLDADLDNIVLMALRKDPERRYLSAQDLADDLDRFLRDLPVKARKESLPYVCRKFLKRKRGLITAVALTTIIVVAAVLGFGQLTRPRIGKEIDVRSIAELPLENLSRDKEQEYFADGITDALITELARIRSLRVISRTSAMSYKGVHRPVAEIGRNLGVQTIAEGSVLRAGNRVRISIRLIDAPRDRPIWSGSYEGELKDVLALQGQVTEAISAEIHVTLTAPDQARLLRQERVNLEAYDAYLKGRHQYLNGFNKQSMESAITWFQKALSYDPSYAPAYAGLADCYYVVSNQYYPPTEAMPKARSAALRALQLDDTLGETHATLALIRSVYDFNRAEAGKEFKRAIELSPSNAEVHLWYALHLISTSRVDEALAEVDRAQKLDPVSPALNGYIGPILYFAHKYDAIIKRMQPIIEMHPDYQQPYAWVALAYEQKREWTKAIATMEKNIQLDGGEIDGLPQLAHMYAMAGRTANAWKMLRRLKALSARRYVPAYDIGLMYAGLGRWDDAFHWLQKVEQDRSEGFAYMNVDPRLGALHADPRFAGMLRSVGLAQ